jgi:hypothetical protein
MLMGEGGFFEHHPSPQESIMAHWPGEQCHTSMGFCALMGPSCVKPCSNSPTQLAPQLTAAGSTGTGVPEGVIDLNLEQECEASVMDRDGGCSWELLMRWDPAMTA